jgi:hypothetical protein
MDLTSTLLKCRLLHAKPLLSEMRQKESFHFFKRYSTSNPPSANPTINPLSEIENYRPMPPYDAMKDCGTGKIYFHQSIKFNVL